MITNLDSLRCFLAAVRHSTFRAAAASVALSPAAFGEHVKRLERELGAALFERTTRSMRLTSAGERLVPEAQRVFATLERCTALVQSGDETTSVVELRLGTRYELGLSWLLPCLEQLKTAAGLRQLHLHFGDTPELLRKLRSGELDALVTSARITGQRLRHVPLHEEHYAFVAQPRLLARLPLRGPRDSPQHTLIDAQDDLPLFRYLRDARPAGESWQFARFHYLSTIAAMRTRVLSGAGVAVLPRYFVAPDLARGRLTELMAKTAMAPDWFRLFFQPSHPREEQLLALGAALASQPLC